MRDLDWSDVLMDADRMESELAEQELPPLREGEDSARDLRREHDEKYGWPCQ